MSLGIPENSLTMIKNAIANWPEIEKAAIFGSRAMGNYKKGSDVDLAIYGGKGNGRDSKQIKYLVESRIALAIPF